MKKTIEIINNTKEIRTGQPIVLFVHGTDQLPLLLVEPEINSTSLDSFTLKAVRIDEDSWQTEFSVAVAGKYTVKSEETSAQLIVVEQKFMSFEKDSEFLV